MKKEAFQGIAKHFAESIKVQLIFEEGATPSTDGNTIILPTEMSEDYLDETLGALLHETNHIRYSDMVYFKSLVKSDKLLGLVTNFMEDIRVDYKSLSVYPNSRCFYTSLITDVMSRAKDTLLKEELPIKKLKSLLLEAHGFDIKQLYGEDENFADIEETVNDLRKTIFEVYDCPNTQSLVPHTAAVIKRIFGEQPEKPPQEQQGAGNPENQPCNGGQGGSGTGEGTGSGEGTPEDNNDDEKTDEEKAVEQAIEKYCDSLEDYADAKEKDKELSQKAGATSEEAKKDLRSSRTYATKARRLDNDIANQGGSPEDVEKLNRLNQKAQEKAQAYRQKMDELRDIQKDLNAVRDEEYTAKNEYENAKRTINKSGFGQSDNCNLLGFNALDTDKLIDKNYVETPYNPTLDEIIKETLILKQEQYQIEETGKLNTRYLHEIYTDVENLWQEKEQIDIKTRVSLIVDTSGSMDSCRGDACMNAVNILATAFKKATDVGAPGEMSIYAFSNDCMPALTSIEQYKPANFTWRNFLHATRKVSGGGTNMAKCVNEVIRENEGDPEFRNVIIVITDACVDSNEINSMVNNISTSDARVMYIAVQANIQQGSPEYEIFGENNIQGTEDAPAILERVMFTGLQQVS